MKREIIMQMLSDSSIQTGATYEERSIPDSNFDFLADAIISLSPIDKGEITDHDLSKIAEEWAKTMPINTGIKTAFAHGFKYSALRNHVPDVGKEVEIVPDYRLLLEKYIKYVFEEEGTDCLTFISHSGLGDFTDEDWSILQEISKKVNG